MLKIDEQNQQNRSKVDEAIHELPTLPSAIAQLIALSISDDRYFEKVKELSEQDPTFTSRIIQIANSAANAPIEQITSISHAVSRIGTRQIKGLITAIAIAKIFVPKDQSELNLWIHSIQVAVASQAIAQMVTKFNVDQEQAYLCGLLHDIGRFILFNVVHDGPVRIDEKDWEEPEKLIDAERKVCGLSHAKLGAHAAKIWGLPSPITNVIASHHEYDYQTLTPQEGKEAFLVQIVQMADYLSVLMMREPDIVSLPPEELQSLIEDKCVHASWNCPPVSPLLLQNEVKGIHDRAARIIRGLGIGIDEEI